MNRDEVFDLMQKEVVISHNYFSEDEFLLIKNGNIYDEGGYKWEIENFLERPEEGWYVYLDIKNLIKEKKQYRNELCSCSSGKKYKKCCYLTQDEKIKIQNYKIKSIEKTIKAIDAGKSVRMYEIDAQNKFNNLMPLLESIKMDSDKYFKITKRR